MMRRWALLALRLAISILWSLAAFRLLSHLIPPNLNNPAVYLLLSVTAPLVGQFQWLPSDFALYQEGIWRSITAVVVLSVGAIASLAIPDGKVLDNTGN
jgi:uncharacterized protein YggT (Ycf19 family)